MEGQRSEVTAATFYAQSKVSQSHLDISRRKRMMDTYRQAGCYLVGHDCPKTSGTRPRQRSRKCYQTK